MGHHVARREHLVGHPRDDLVGPERHEGRAYDAGLGGTRDDRCRGPRRRTGVPRARDGRRLAGGHPAGERTRAHPRWSALRRRHARCRHHRDGVGDGTAHRVGDDPVRRVGAPRRAHRGRRRRAGARWPQLAGARTGIDVGRPDVHRGSARPASSGRDSSTRVTSRCPRSLRRTTARRCCHPRRAANTDIAG